MRKPLMPKATASWLIENTTLSFRQISEFVELHTLEIQAIADDEVSSGILPRNPIEHGELTHEEIKNCEKDESKNLKIKVSDIPIPVNKTKGARYTPLSKRADKPNGIYWLVKNLPSIPDSKVCKLIGTTKKTVQSIRVLFSCDGFIPETKVCCGFNLSKTVLNDLTGFASTST